jgi:hypothetical protein
MPSIAGKTGITGYKVRREQVKKTRDEITLTLVEKKLKSHVDGLIELSQTQVMAARILYDKLRPSLSAVEQTITNESDLMSEADIVQKLQALIQAYPDLVRSLLHAPALDQPEAIQTRPDGTLQ